MHQIKLQFKIEEIVPDPVFSFSSVHFIIFDRRDIKKLMVHAAG